jgi:hypothetical protein
LGSVVFVEDTCFEQGMALFQGVQSGMQAHGRYLSEQCRMFRRNPNDSRRFDHGIQR